MKPSVENSHSTTTNVLSKREEKKSINIRSNAFSRFLVGLTISILLVLLVFESGLGSSYIDNDWNEKKRYVEDLPLIASILIESQPNVKVAVAPKKTERKPIVPIINPEKIIFKAQPDVGTPTVPSEGAKMVPDPSKKANTISKKVPEKFNVVSVEFVPVFPGCEGGATRKEKIDCMSSKINKFINRHFNTDVAEGTSGERQRIHVRFKIDASGRVTEVIAKAGDKSLEKEAKRVISKLPNMQPGKQGATPVDVMYMVPIIFQLN